MMTTRTEPRTDCPNITQTAIFTSVVTIVLPGAPQSSAEPPFTETVITASTLFDYGQLDPAVLEPTISESR